MIYCLDCKTNVSAEQKEKCKDEKHDLDYENLMESTTIIKDRDEKNKIEKLFGFAKTKIVKLVQSQDDYNQVLVKLRNNSHIETLNLDSKNAQYWLMYNYKRTSGEMFIVDNYRTVLQHLKADAFGNGSIHEKVYVRIAQHENEIFYDLLNREWNLIKITQEGYKIQNHDEKTPVFDRMRGMVEQMKPKEFNGDPLERLCILFRISEEERVLFKVHLIHFFLQEQESPIMVITGEHGSIKTTLTQGIKKIVDPSSSNLGSLPGDVKELPNALSNKYLCAFDNVSGFKHETSDILCRAITGDEIAKRALFTDNDLYVMSYQRKIILNGISPNIEYPDFIDRSIVYETKNVPEGQKMTKSDFWRYYNKLLPYVLDQIFKILSQVLRNHEKIGDNIQPLTRMADFEKYGETISQSLGYEPEKFLKFYRNTRDTLEISNIDSYPIISLIINVLKDKSNFTDSIRDLYYHIKKKGKEEEVDITSKYSNFPKTVKHFSRQMNQLKPQFRALDIEFEIYRYEKRDGKFDKGTTLIHMAKTNVPCVPNVPKDNHERKNPEQKQTGTHGTDGTYNLGNTKENEVIELSCSKCSFKLKTKRKHYPKIQQAHQKGHYNDTNHILREAKMKTSDSDTIGGEGILDE